MIVLLLKERLFVLAPIFSSTPLVTSPYLHFGKQGQEDKAYNLRAPLVAPPSISEGR
jgi:hypothetical protein